MDDSTALLLLIFVFLSIHGLINMMSASLFNAHRAIIRERAETGDKTAQSILALTNSPLKLAMTLNVIRALVYFAIPSTFVLIIIQETSELDTTSRIIVGVITTIVAASMTLVTTDLVPEALGSAYADILVRMSIRPLQLVIFLLSPLTSLLLLISRIISRTFGGEQLVNRVTEEEIMTLVNAGHTGGTIEEEEKDMIYSVLQLGETTARELMTPRIDIVALEVGNTIEDALSVFVESGFSRVPIYEESIDNVIGLLYAKDILTLMRDEDALENKSIRDLTRPSYFIPETKRADELLKELQARNVHLAMVVDEYGGTSGLVTIENLIEEIIGDIRDEYDYDEEEEYIMDSNGVYVMDAGMDLDDVNELLDCSIDTEDADTLGGYIFLRLGRVPVLGEVVESDVLTMTVKSIDGHRIRKVEVIRKDTSKQDDTIVNTTDFSHELKDEAS
jgi:putative hemolysin